MDRAIECPRAYLASSLPPVKQKDPVHTKQMLCLALLFFIFTPPLIVLFINIIVVLALA